MPRTASPIEGPDGAEPQQVLAAGPLQTVAPRSFILIGLFLMILFHTLLVARALFLPLVVAFFLSFLLRPPLRLLKRVHVPEALGAALLLLVLVGGVGVGLHSLNPVVIFVGLLFWFFLWGIPGALLAVPTLAVFKIVCDHVDTLAPIGEFFGPADAA